MFRGTFILRLGLALVFGYFAVSQVMDPLLYTSYLPESLASNGLTFVYLNAALDGLLAVLIFFSIFPRIAPAIAAAHLMAIAFTMGFNDVAVRDFGLAMACLALVFIHEERIPWRQRMVLNRFFGGRH